MNFTWLPRRDETYAFYESELRPKSLGQKLFYLSLYLAPGLFLCLLINNRTIYDAVVLATGGRGSAFQYLAAIVIAIGWQIGVPLWMLTERDGLSFRQSVSYLGLDRIDLPSMLVYMPVTFLAFVLVSIPYTRYAAPALSAALNTVPWLRLPEYTIFRSGAETLCIFPPVMTASLFIALFVGQELYFRGFLMKKSAFLGRWNWAANGVLFTFGHFWQIPLTWPLVGLMLVYGAYMQWRKDLWSLVVLHVLINLVWEPTATSLADVIWR